MKPILNINKKTSSQVARKGEKVNNKQASLGSLINVRENVSFLTALLFFA